MYTVYCHTNKINGKKYFGITDKKPERRWGHNGCRYLKKTYGVFNHPAFANAIIKYGWDSFEHEILYEGLTLEEASQKEMELIAQYKTNVVRYGKKYGYNMTDGGEGCTGGKHYSGKDHPMYGKHQSEEARKKMSEHWKEFYSDPANHTHTGENATFYGHHHTEESKKKISAANSGANHGSARSVLCVETGEIFPTLKAAADACGGFPSNIGNVCRGKRPTMYGYHWQYVEEKAAS